MPGTILSLHKGNKNAIPFVQSKFNMGGSGVLEFCGVDHNVELVLSKRNPKLQLEDAKDSDKHWSFTIIRREDPSPASPRASRFTYLAPAAQGVTRVDDTGVGLLQDFTEIATSSYGVSLLAAGVVAGGDRLGLSISQPLRAWRAGARAVVPTGIDYASGAVTHSREGVELVAGGREIDLEVSYAFTPFRGVDLGANLLYQHEPGHMREAAGAATLVIRLNRRF